MFRSAILTAAVTLGAAPLPAPAQVILPGVVSRPSYVIPVSSYTVQFRSLSWSERIFANPLEARQFELLKRAEGFETLSVRHGLHTHVSYRSAFWQRYRTVSSHHLANELARHLEYRGFEACIVRY